LERGVGLCEAGDIGVGVLWLQRSLEAAPPDDETLGQAIRGLLGGWCAQMHSLRYHHRHAHPIHALAFDRAGKHLATAVDEQVFLYRADGKPAGPVKAFGGKVLALCSLAEGMAAIVQTGNAVRAHALPDGSPLGPTVQLPARPRSAALSPDGYRLLVG